MAEKPVPPPTAKRLRMTRLSDVPASPIVTVVFRPLKSDVPIEARVRRLLKSALRSCHLRCVDYRIGKGA